MPNSTLFLIAIVVVMVAAIPTAMVLKDYLPGFLERSASLDQLENRIYVLHAEGQELKDRVASLTAQRNQISLERSRVESDIRKMEKQIADLAAQPPQFIHELGEPKVDSSKFTANLTLEKASSQARNGGERAPVNPIWRCNNVAEVWAQTIEEARQLVDTAYPFKLGFQAVFVTRPKASEAPATSASKGGGAKGSQAA